MKVLKYSIILMLLIFILLFVVVFMFSPPQVGFQERKEINSYVKKYLTNKYGDHKCRISKISYEFQMDTLFDYSTRKGYEVRVNCDVVNTYVNISGVYPDEYTVFYDDFITDYYFPDKDGFEIYELKKSMTPTKNIEDYYFVKIYQEFDPSILTLKCGITTLNPPDNFGRIPTLEEIKSDPKVYDVLDFYYTVENRIENKEEYENKLKLFLHQSFGGEWRVYFRDDTLVSLSKD